MSTTVSGNIKNLGTGAVGVGNFVRFWLRGYGQNTPRVTGSAIVAPQLNGTFYFDIQSDANGNLSGTLYSTRDASGSGNGDIEAGGSYLAVWYGMQVYNGSYRGPEIPVHAKSGATLDPSSVTPITTPPVVSAPTGDGTYLQLTAGNGPVTGLLTLSAGAVTKKLNGIRFADQFSGSDIGAKINAAVADLAGAGTIYVPSGGSYSTDIVLAANQSLVSMAAAEQVVLTYTGTGNAITTVGRNTISGISLAVGTSATRGFYLKGQDIRLQNSYITGGGASTKLIHIAAVDGSTQSGKVFVENVHGDSTNGTQIYIDHVIEAHVERVYISATGSSSTGCVIDTGTSGVHFDDVSFVENTLGGLVIKNSTGGAGAYNAAPLFMWFDQCVFDAALSPAADAILFDSTLSTNPIYATFNGCWAAGHAHNGIHISGGQGIRICGGTKIRSNGLNGVLLDNANVASVLVSGSFISGNNTTNNADAHGVYVNQACVRVTLKGNDIGNHLDSTGHQKYGFKVGAFNADDFLASGNNLADNVTGYYLDGNTGSRQIVGNSSISGTAKSWLHGDLQVHGSIFNDAGIFATNIQVNAATGTATSGQVNFGTTAGFGNGSSGTAMTTTAKGTGSGPATAQTVVNYLKVNIGGSDFWIPLMQ